jgi:hypothetical protein
VQVIDDVQLANDEPVDFEPPNARSPDRQPADGHCPTASAPTATAASANAPMACAAGGVGRKDAGGRRAPRMQDARVDRVTNAGSHRMHLQHKGLHARQYGTLSCE